MIYSGFTWSVLKDSGWYGIDIKYSDVFVAGKNMGCSFIDSCYSNNNLNYFCPKEGRKDCDYGYTSAGICSQTGS